MGLPRLLSVVVLVLATAGVLACTPVVRRPSPTPPDDAIAFVARFLDDLSDDVVVGRIDLRARLVRAYCLTSWDGSVEWCGDFHELDRALVDPTVAEAERRHTVTIAREHLSAECQPTGVVRPVTRRPSIFGNRDSRTGETDATAAELARYREFIATIAEEGTVSLDCGARGAIVFVVRFRGESEYYVTGSADVALEPPP